MELKDRPAPHHERAGTVRGVGYRILPGDSFSYLLHMRPAEWPIMAAHTLLGYVLAVGAGGVIWGDQRGTALWAVFIWVVLLNGGTLAINSVFDRDEGDIGYLRDPPRPPRYLLEFSAGLMIAGMILSFTLPPAFRVVYAACFLLSILYSVPPFRFKAVAGLDWVINMIGFGTLTPLATFVATTSRLDLVNGLVLLAFCPLFAALYPLTQLYQFEEDTKRGDRTLALILGMKNSLIVAITACVIAFGLFIWAWVLKSMRGYAGGLGAGGIAAILVALAAWLVVLIPWIREHRKMSPGRHQAGMYKALAAWAVTDIAVVLAFAA